MKNDQPTPVEERRLILVIDDDIEINNAANEMLTAAGYDVISKFNWTGARDAVMELKPDLVVMGVSLPDASGVEKCREISRAIETKDVPVILMSEFGDDPIRASSFLAGARQFINKVDIYRVLVREAAVIFAKARMRRTLWEEIADSGGDSEEYLRSFAETAVN